MRLLICFLLTLLPAAAEPYHMIFLRRAPDLKALPQAEAERISAAHMANIQAMANAGLLVAAGPFDDKPTVISGLFLFKAASLDEARRVAGQDPTVLEHRNTVEGFTWDGPKGIGEEYVRLHKADPKTPEDMGVHPLALLYRGTGAAGAAHAEYLAKLKAQGKLAASGPVTSESPIAEVLIFRRISSEEAQALIAADPAVKAGVLRAEMHRWYSAAHVLP